MRHSAAGLAVGLMLGIAPISHAAEIVAPSSASITQTVVTLDAGVDAVVGSRASRRYLCLMNIGTGLVTLAFDQAAVAGSGWAIGGATEAGHQGGSMCWENVTVVGSEVRAISAAGSTLVVLEAR